MRVTTIDRYVPAAGELVVFAVDGSAAATQDCAVPPSFNQSIHLGSAEAGIYLHHPYQLKLIRFDFG